MNTRSFGARRSVALVALTLAVLTAAPQAHAQRASNDIQRALDAAYAKYKNLNDMLKVILFSSQSALGLTPMLYHIKYKEKEILFIETGALGGALVHYIVEKGQPSKKFIELRQLTGEYNFVEKIGNDTHSIYIPLLELDSTSIEFPI